MITTPNWLKSQTPPKNLSTKEQKMAFVIELSRKNIENKTGGPFGAAIFDSKTNELISVGVNLVTSLNQSMFHAEVVAIMNAQKKLKTFDLKSQGNYELYTSTEPCIMCMGAIIWAGLIKLYCGAEGKDAENIGFDEGPKPENWPGALEARGIEVVRNLLGNEARRVLGLYKNQAGFIY
jgi:tRNA(Arg) A34 adenosine deaminase TadA